MRKQYRILAPYGASPWLDLDATGEKNLKAFTLASIDNAFPFSVEFRALPTA